MTHRTGKLKLAVVVSGGGTNLQALIDRAASGALSAQIVVVASDRADAHGLVRAREAGIPAHVVDYGKYTRAPARGSSLPVDLKELDRVQRIVKNPDPAKRLERLARLVSAERELIGVLEKYRPDYICLAGFMRLVTPYFLSHFNREGEWRVLNIHPALLPAFPGEHGYEDTFAYGARWGGVTVHFVDEGEDSGPVIAQMVYPIWPDDDVESVRRRGLLIEYEIYAQCVNWLAAGQVELVVGEGGRGRTLITDPEYPRILESWMCLSFESR